MKQPVKSADLGGIGRRFLIYFILLAFAPPLVAQNLFKGVLLNLQDSSAIPFAAVRWVGGDQATLTDENGEFQLSLSRRIDTLSLEVTAIGTRVLVKHAWKGEGLEQVLVDQQPAQLDEVQIQGLSAREVVKRAVAAIPRNYSDSSYATPAFYRQYNRINGRFANLIEAHSMVLFFVTAKRKELEAKEAFTMRDLRRSDFQYPVENVNAHEYADLMGQNPIYHLEQSSLYPGGFSAYEFWFDRSTEDLYVIRYRSPQFSSETHGISSTAGFLGESSEHGVITIDKESFAIVRYERVAKRNKGYNYPRNNNFVLPSRKHTVEFVEGHLIAEYKKYEDKWYLKTLLHRFTNDFFETRFYRKDYTLTEVYEWFPAQPLKYLTEDLSDQLTYTPSLSTWPYRYRPESWEGKLPSFFFFPQEMVLRDLEEKEPLELQFEKEGGL